MSYHASFLQYGKLSVLSKKSEPNFLDLEKSEPLSGTSSLRNEDSDFETAR